MLTMAGRVVGAVVDGVSDVVNLAPEQVRQPPELGCSLDTEYVRGLGIVAERMLILLDIEKLMSGPGMALAHAT